MAWNGELKYFSDFYSIEEKQEGPSTPTVQDHIQMMRDRGEGGPPC